MGGDVWTASGDPAKIVGSGSIVTIAEAEITGVDVDASHGVIHVIDEVMVPASVNRASAAGRRAVFGSGGPASAPQQVPSAPKTCTQYGDGWANSTDRPSPIWVYAGRRMFSRWPGESIHPAMTA